MIWELSVSGMSRGDDTDLDNFVSWKRQKWDVCRITGHQVAIQHSQDTLVCDNQQVILLSLQLQNNRFQSNGHVVVRLGNVSSVVYDRSYNLPLL